MTRRTTKRTRRTPREFGTVEPRGDRWRAFYRVEGQVIRAPRPFDDEFEARSWLMKEEAAHRDGSWVDPNGGKITLAEYAAEWLDTRPDLAPTTLQGYRGLLDRWILPKLGRFALTAVTPAKVRRWRAECLTDAAEGTKPRPLTRAQAVRVWALEQGHDVAPTGRLSPDLVAAWEAAGSPIAEPERTRDGSAQVVGAYRVLRALMNAAVEDRAIAENPCRIKGAGEVHAAERRPATPAEVVAIADAMPRPWRAAVHVAAWSALRHGELFALARRHVDLDAGTLRVERAVVRLRGEPPTFGPTKTRGSVRTVHLPAFVVDILRAHMDEFTGPDPDALVFTSRAGGIVDASLSRDFRQAREAAGRPDLRWHDLRHTASSLALRAGAGMADVKRRLGHTTMRAAAIYAHAFDDSDKVIAERLDEMFRPGLRAVS